MKNYFILFLAIVVIGVSLISCSAMSPDPVIVPDFEISDNILGFQFENNSEDANSTNNLVATGSPAYVTSDSKQGSYHVTFDESSFFETENNYVHGTNAITVSAWLYMDSALSVNIMTFMKYDDFVIAWFKTEELLKAYIVGETAAETALTANTWHHVITTYNGTTMKIYLNGSTTPVIEQNQTGDFSTFDAKILVGSYSAAGLYYWLGKMDDIRIYDRVLSTGEITALYDSY